MFLKFFFYSSYLLIYPTAGPELIIGEERVSPGIIFIFEGAVKDQITPNSLHLDIDKTNVHIEARVNWDNKDIPKGWCFIFPSCVTHPHQANPLISGTKYTLSSWTHPKSWGLDHHGGSILYNEL